MCEEVLTEEQKSFLEECDMELINRFTEQDAEFMKMLDKGIPPVPVICPWYGERWIFSNNNNSKDCNNQSKTENHQDGAK